MPLKVVYLDDEPGLCQTFVDNFSSDEVSIKTFTHPPDAVAAIQHDPPDIVFIDYRLIGTTGDDVAKLLDPKLRKVLVTGDLAVEPASKFDRILHKPFDFDGLEAYLLELARGNTA